MSKFSREEKIERREEREMDPGLVKFSQLEKYQRDDGGESWEVKCDASRTYTIVCEFSLAGQGRHEAITIEEVYNDGILGTGIFGQPRIDFPIPDAEPGAPNIQADYIFDNYTIGNNVDEPNRDVVRYTYGPLQLPETMHVTAWHQNTPPDAQQATYVSNLNTAQIDDDALGVQMSWAFLDKITNIHMRAN